jgi:hypothetical protein
MADIELAGSAGAYTNSIGLSITFQVDKPPAWMTFLCEAVVSGLGLVITSVSPEIVASSTVLSGLVKTDKFILGDVLDPDCSDQ